MLKRASICVVLAAFVAGLGSSASAETLPLVKHNTRIVFDQLIVNGETFTFEGDLRSGYRPCTQRRLVGLFQNGEQVGPLARSRLDGTFTLTIPDSGAYEIVAFKHARDCNHLCRTAREDIAIGEQGQTG